jgi:hypothetical protein
MDGELFGRMLEGLVVGMAAAGIIAGAAIFGTPVAVYSYYRGENLQVIVQEGQAPIIKTTEKFRSDRVYIPIQTTDGKLEYLPMKKYLSSLEVLDKSKRNSEETRLKAILENSN